MFNFNCVNTISIFDPDEMKSVRENEANRFCFPLILRHPAKVKVTESGRKWQKSVVNISMAGEMSNVGVCHARWPTMMANTTNYINPCYSYGTKNRKERKREDPPTHRELQTKSKQM